MATYTAKNNGYTVELTLTPGTQSRENNTTVIKYSLVLKSSTNYFYLYPVGHSIVLDGHTVSSRPGSGHQESINQYSSLTLASGSTTITHESNGEKTVSISFAVWVNDQESYLPGTIKGAGSLKLTTIPRASAIASVSDVILGSQCTVKWVPASSSFRYKLRFEFGGWGETTGYIEPGRSTEYSCEYTIPVSLADQIPSSTFGTGTVYLYTYSGDNQIGSAASKPFTAYVPDDVVPTVTAATASIVNSNSVIAGWGIAVSGYTRIKLVASASGAYGSSISGFIISGWYSANQDGGSLSYEGPTIWSNGDSVFKIVARDSRGRTSNEKNANTILFYAYSSPRITQFSIGRSGSDVEKIVVSAAWSFASLGGKNSASGVLQYRKSTENTWTTYGEIANGTTVTLSETFSKLSSYIFRLSVTDAVGNAAQQDSPVSTMQVLVAYRAGGKGIAFGKFSEEDNFDVAMDAKFDGQMTVKNMAWMNGGSIVKGGMTGISGSAGYVRILVITITGTYQNSPIVFEYLNRGWYPARGYIRFKNENDKDPGLDVCKIYSQYNQTYYIVKSTTSTWDVYVKKSEPYDSIAITRLEYNRNYGGMNIEVDGKNHVTSLPSGYIDATPMSVMADNVIVANEVLVGSDGKQHNIRFPSTNHNSGFYGGNDYSTTALGAWDWKNGRRILVYNDSADSYLDIGNDDCKTYIGGSNVYIQGNMVASIIVDANGYTIGSTTWSYKKYSDGSCDLWGDKYVDKNCSIALGSWYRSETITMQDLPFAITNCMETFSFKIGPKNSGCMLWNTKGSGGTSGPSFYLIRPTNGTAEGYICVHIFAKWK